MADVQLENGYTRIANELLEALTMYDFTGQERKLLDAVIRLSYGCGKKTATFPSWSACESFGLPRQHIHSPKKSSGILDKLVLNNVLVVDYDTKTVGIQKYYSKWKIAPKEIASKKKFHALIEFNLKCNLQVTNVTHRLQDKCNPQVTGLSPTGYNDVTHRLQEHTVDSHEHKPQVPPKESKEIKDIRDHVRDSVGLDTPEKITQFGFYLNSIYEICNPTAEDHLAILTEIVKAKDRETIIDALEPLRQANVALADRLDWLYNYLIGDNNGKE